MFVFINNRKLKCQQLTKVIWNNGTQLSKMFWESFFIFLFWRSAAAISVKDGNGTFISTLNLLLYNVSSHQIKVLYGEGVLDEHFKEHKKCCRYAGTKHVCCRCFVTTYMFCWTKYRDASTCLILTFMCRIHHMFSSCPSPWQDWPWRPECLQLWKPITWTGGIQST